MEAKIKGVLWGIGVVILMVLFNWIALALLNYPIMAIGIINQYWYLFVFLIGGFGLQVGLFFYYNSLNVLSCGTTVVSGGISVVSMIICCSHYILNLLPFLGALVGVSFFSVLSEYTLHFLILGVISNIIGLGVIFYQRGKYFGSRK
jgi:hypothetical protein